MMMKKKKKKTTKQCFVAIERNTQFMWKQEWTNILYFGITQFRELYLI